VKIRATIVIVAVLAFLYPQYCHRETPQEMLAQARIEAQRHGKSLMVEFGASWCSDCRDLERNLKQAPTRENLEKHFDVLYVDVGEFNKNLDVARSLGINVGDGIPVAAFFPPGGAGPITKRGNAQILAHLADVAHNLESADISHTPSPISSLEYR